MDKKKDYNRIQLLLQVITALGTIAVFVSLYILYYGIHEEHEWNRRRYTTDLIGDFDSHVVQYREMLTEYFPEVYKKGIRNILELEVAEKIWRLEVDNKDIKHPYLNNIANLAKVRHQLIGLLNYLEFLSIAYQQSIVDQRQFEETLADPIFLYHDYLIAFINASQAELKYPNWKPISDVANNIRFKRQKNMSNPIPPTGQL